MDIEEESPGVLRGFLIALAITIGFPLLVVLVAMSNADAAVINAFVLAPLFAYAFPPLLFVPDGGIGTALLSLLVMLGFSWACGMITGHRRAAVQFLHTLGLLALWCIFWFIVALAVGVQPNFELEM